MSREPESGENADVACLRAALRLCFEPARADALAARAHAAEPDPARRLAPAVRLARLSTFGGRLLRLGSAGGANPPLHPRPGLPTNAALALALHLGLDLNGERLARLLGRTPEEIGLWLRQARQAVDVGGGVSCPEFAAALGRQRDPALPRAEQLALLRHLAGCRRCREVLEHDRALDARLLQRIHDIERDLPDAPAARARLAPLLLGPALRVGAALLLVLLLGVAAVAGSRRLLARGSGPVPLVAPVPANGPLGGWLLETFDGGEVDAFDLSSGARRVLIPGQPGDDASVVVSPDQRRIAVLTQGGENTDHAVALQVYALDGREEREWGDFDSAARTNTVLQGWLNPDTLLVSASAINTGGRGNPSGTAPPLPVGQLLALNVTSGARQVLVDQDVFQATVSPDGRYVALNGGNPGGKPNVEIRPFDGRQLGDPLTAVPGVNFTGLMRWTPDSRRVLFTQLNVDGSGLLLETLSLDGRITALLSHARPGYLSLIGISPDGRRAFYAESATNSGAAIATPTTLWQVPLDGGASTQVLIVDSGVSQLVAAPNGDALAVTATAFRYPLVPGSGAALEATPTGAPGRDEIYANHTVTLALGPDGRRLGTLLDQFVAGSLLAWLPEDALPTTAPPVAAPSHAFGQPEEVVALGAQVRLSVESQISPNGRELLLESPDADFSVAIPLLSYPPLARVAGPAIDPSWLPDGGSVMGVDRIAPQAGGSSRLSIFVPQNGLGSAPAEFDPANLGNSTSQQYRQPQMAPNGLRYNFFVTGQQRVALWIGGQGGPARSVLDWTLPPGAGVEPPLLARWVSNDALVIAVPEDWSGGWPGATMLERVSLAPDGTVKLERLARWHTRGDERGIVLQELALTSDQSRLALRLRAFSGGNPSAAQTDAIVILPADDLSQSLEVARGSQGDGLSWAPDGRELAAGLHGHILLLAADGSRSDQLSTGDAPAAYPLWVQPGEIWYASGSGDDVKTMRVTLSGR